MNQWQMVLLEEVLHISPTKIINLALSGKRSPQEERQRDRRGFDDAR